jgi:hypothetical protein
MRVSIPPDWHMPAAFSSRLGDSAGRQRAMASEGHLLLVLHEPPAPGSAERAGRLFWRDAEGVWHSRNPGDGLQALKRHVGDFADRLDEFEKQWQAAGTAEEFYGLLRAVAPLHRTARNLYSTLQKARELFPEDRDLINLRDRAGEIDRAAELLHGDAKHGLDFTVAHQAEQQAERSYEMAVAAHRLNVLAATFLPIATLSGLYGAIFGMLHVHGRQEWSTPALFWGIMAVAMLSGFLLARLIARKPTPVTKPALKARGKRVR